MKLVIQVTSLLILLAISAFSQNISTKDDKENLYYQAFRTYLEKTEQRYSKLFPERNFRNVVAAKDSFITKNLPNKIEIYSIQFVNYDELIEIVKKYDSKNSEPKISVIEIQPIKNEGNSLVEAISKIVSQQNNDTS
jgi:hypothetical protein